MKSAATCWQKTKKYDNDVKCCTAMLNLQNSSTIPDFKKHITDMCQK